MIHVYAWHIMIDVWTQYGGPRYYVNGETDLITKTWHFLRFSLHRKPIPISCFQQLSSQEKIKK